MSEINYYILDEIVQEDLGNYWGKLNGESVEVFPLSSEDSEQELIDSGFAKCDAPGTETFVVEESSISSITSKP